MRRWMLALGVLAVVGVSAGPAWRADAYVLRAQPPDRRLAMNLDLPTTPAQTVGYGMQSFYSLAHEALNRWNQVGVGNPADTGFFGLRTPVVTGDPCSPDGVNEVRRSSTICGADWGDYIGMAVMWPVGGRIVECDVMLNSTVPWNAYPGPLRRAAVGGWLYDVLRLALHEAGHCLGLDHADKYGQAVVSVMNSSPGNIDGIQADDIAGAHAVNWTCPGGCGGGGGGLDGFITRFYRNVLGREPDPGGLANWRAFFQANPTSQGAATFAHGFLESPEFLGRNHPTSTYVTILYRSFMGREPDPAGHANWVNHLNAGRYTRRGVADLFIESAEFQAAWRALF